MVPILRVQQPPAGLLLMADNLPKFMELTVSIVSAYVRHNSVPSAELPALIGQVHTELTRVSSGHGQALANALTTEISPMLICVVGTGTLAGAMASRGRALPQAAGRGAKGTRTRCCWAR